MTRDQAVQLNALGLYCISAVLAVAFAGQIILNELPCPLCMLQRMQFALLAVGPILNIRYGPRPSHYAMSLLAALLGAAIAARQIVLHILPGDAGYGSTLLGYHYYTWAFIAFAMSMVLIALIMLFDRQFEREASLSAASSPTTIDSVLIRMSVWLVIALVGLNVVSTVAMCGFEACSSDPTQYRLLR